MNNAPTPASVRESKRSASRSKVTTEPSVPSESWGSLSSHVYEQAKRPLRNLDETSPPTVPYAKPYYSVSEYLAYTDQMDELARSFFLLLVAFSLKSDGL